MLICGVKADRVIRTGDIKIDRAGHTDGIDAPLRQRSRAPEGTVAADNYQSLNSVLPADLRPRGPALPAGTSPGSGLYTELCRLCE